MRRVATNLREGAPPLVGRASDLASLRALVEEARLVTITGAGGIGKTSLAEALARSLVARYSAHGGGGVWFCDLCEARNASDLCAAVAATSGVRLAAGAHDEPTIALGRALGRRGRLLLVLDNFEQLAPDARDAVAEWLAVAPHLRVLITSRVPLDLPDEHLWPLGPLAPDEAAALFVQHARRLRPSLDPASIDRALVGRVVDALDAIPLAIELAASRLLVLPIGELSRRLERPLELLERRGDGRRHASMRRTVLDSVALLGADAARAFAACAVFRNAFALDAAEAVFAGTLLARDQVLPALEALVRHSLLRASFGEAEGQARYAFFASVREVAAELLANEPARAALEQRVVAHYAALAQTLGAEAALYSGGVAFERLGRDLENALQAHALALAHGKSVEALSIALGLDPVLSARGLSRLRLRLLEVEPRADAARQTADRGSPDLAPDPATLAQTWLARGLAQRELGETELARRAFEQALALATEAARPDLAAAALTRIGDAEDVAGRTDRARALFERALALLEETPPSPMRTLREAEARVRLGHAMRREGSLVASEAAIAAAITRYATLGHDEGLAGALYEAAVVAMFRGDEQLALDRFDEGLRVARRSGVAAIAGALTTARGCLLQDRGELQAALEHHAEAARVFRSLGSRYREASAEYYLATAHLERGDAREAVTILRRARATVEGVGAPRYEALIEGALACALSMLGERAAAEVAIDLAERAAARCETEPALGATIHIHRRTQESLARADAPPHAEIERVLTEAKARSAAHPTDDSRFALRMLERAVRRAAPSDVATLIVLEDGAGFRSPGGASFVMLPRRSPLRRILALLAHRRVAAPGETVAVEEIIACGWPGERMRSESAQNRAYVALAALRKLGLRAFMVTGAGGYSLSEATSVTIETALSRAPAT
jgi:predicted ATPase